MYQHTCGTILEVGMVVCHVGVRGFYLVCETTKQAAKVRPLHAEETGWYPKLGESAVRIVSKEEYGTIPEWLYKYVGEPLEYETVG